MKFYNISFEDKRVMCDGRAFRLKSLYLHQFPDRPDVPYYVEIPDHLADFIYQQNSQWGIFPFKAGMDWATEAKKAAIQYRAFLEERIYNFQRWMDEKKLQGVTLNEPQAMQQYKIWKESFDKILTGTDLSSKVHTFDGVNLSISTDQEKNVVRNQVPWNFQVVEHVDPEVEIRGFASVRENRNPEELANALVQTGLAEKPKQSNQSKQTR